MSQELSQDVSDVVVSPNELLKQLDSTGKEMSSVSPSEYLNQFDSSGRDGDISDVSPGDLPMDSSGSSSFQVIEHPPV